MAKLLPVTGIVAAVLTPLCAVLLTGAGMAILPVLAILAGVFAILERGRTNLIVGIALIVAGLVLAVLAMGGFFGSASAEGTSTGVGSGEWSQWFGILGGTSAILAIVAVRPRGVSPSWLPLAAVALAIVALALFAWKYDQLGNPTGAPAVLYPAAILLLASGYPNLAALRAPAATTHAEQVHHTPPAAEKAAAPAQKPHKAAKKKSAK